MGSRDAAMHTLFPTLSVHDISIYTTRVTDYLPVFGCSWGGRDQRPRPGGPYSVCIWRPQEVPENRLSRADTMASCVEGLGGGGKKERGEPCTAGGLGNPEVFTAPL